MWLFINQILGFIQPPCMLCGAHPHHKDNLCASCMNDIPWNKNACMTCAEYVGPYVFEGDMVCVNCQQKPPSLQNNNLRLELFSTN